MSSEEESLAAEFAVDIATWLRVNTLDNWQDNHPSVRLLASHLARRAAGDNRVSSKERRGAREHDGAGG